MKFSTAAEYARTAFSIDIEDTSRFDAASASLFNAVVAESAVLHSDVSWLLTPEDAWFMPGVVVVCDRKDEYARLRHYPRYFPRVRGDAPAIYIYESDTEHPSAMALKYLYDYRMLFGLLRSMHVNKPAERLSRFAVVEACQTDVQSFIELVATVARGGYRGTRDFVIFGPPWLFASNHSTSLLSRLRMALQSLITFVVDKTPGASDRDAERCV